MRTTITLLPLTALFCAGIAPSVWPAENPPAKVYRIGVVPYFTPEKMWQLFQPLIQYLNKATPFSWELKVGQTHDELVRELCAGTVSVAFLGPIPYAKSQEQCDPQPLLLTLGGDGSPIYHSIIITADPSIRSLRDLRGKKFAFFEKSTAAHYLPLKMLSDEGISKDDIKPVLLASQDRIVSAVLSNEVAAGGIKETLFQAFKSPNLRMLKTSEPLPNFVFAAAPGLPPEVGSAFTEALLRLKPRSNNADREIMLKWDPELANGFTAPPDDFKESTRKLFKSIQPFLK